MKILIIGPKYLFAEVSIIKEATSENITLSWFNTSKKVGSRLIWYLLPFIFKRSFQEALYLAYLDETCGMEFQGRTVRIKRKLGALWRIIMSIRLPEKVNEKQTQAIIVPEVIYRWRLLVYYLKRKYNLPILAMQMGSLYHVYDYNNTSFLYPNSLISKISSNKNCEDFLKRRKNGMVSNMEGNKKETEYESRKFDIGIWLPISLDTPFQSINEKRIFKNYFEWIKYTLDFLSGSNISCLIKFHPSTALWNDSLQNWIFKKYQNIENFQFDLANQHSSIACDRIVSFKGTIAIEELLRGRNSCIINSIPGFDDLLIIPKSLSVYNDYLLGHYNIPILDKTQVEYNLLIREYYMTYIYRLTEKVGFVYRGESEENVTKRMNKLTLIVKQNLSSYINGCFGRAINDQLMLK